MFLRQTKRLKDGKEHRYFSVVENRRVRRGGVVQRTVLYLGEINDSQQAGWRKTLEVRGADSFRVFDEAGQQARTLSLFPEDRVLPPDAVDGVQVKLSAMELRRPRAFGNCWLGCEVWRQLGLDQFWQEQLGIGREAVAWAKVLELLVVNRLIDPGSEWRIHRQWFDQSAMDELLGVDFSVAAKDRLYRCLDRVLEHKPALFQFLQSRWRDLFSASFEVLLYDLTSTYLEGQAREIPKARYGYSRDGRPNCLQLVIALVVTADGFPLAYEVMEGNTSDKTTWRGFLKKIEETYGQARRVWVMDRGIPTEEILAEMRDRQPPVYYLVGTPRSKLSQLEQPFLNLPWPQGPRIGGSKTLATGRRGVRAGQERRAPSEGAGDPAVETGAAVAHPARDAAQWPFAGSINDALRGGQGPSGPSVEFCPHPLADSRATREPPNIPLCPR